MLEKIIDFVFCILYGVFFVIQKAEVGSISLKCEVRLIVSEQMHYTL